MTESRSVSQPSTQQPIAPTLEASIGGSMLTGRSRSIVGSGNLTDTQFDLTFITAETAIVPARPSDQQTGSQPSVSEFSCSTARTDELAQNEKPKIVGRLLWRENFTEDKVWQYNLTDKPGESFSPEKNTIRYLFTLRVTIRSLDRMRSGWRDEGGSEKKDLSDLVDLILATKGAEEIAQKEKRTPEDNKILILGEMGQKVVDKLGWHLRRVEGKSEEDRARSLAWLHEISPLMMQIAGQGFQKTRRLTSIGKTQQHKLDIAEDVRKYF